MIQKIQEWQKIKKVDYGQLGPNAVAINTVIDKLNIVIDKINSFNIINKPVTTTNESPKFDLDKWFENQKQATVFDGPIGCAYGTKRKTKVLQLCGIEVVLFEDGTYILSDTTGG